MIRFVRMMILFAVAAVLVALCLMNREIVTFRLIPEAFGEAFGLSGVLRLPQFVIVFGAVLVGLMVGALREYFRGHGSRRLSGERGREVRRLQREVETLREQAGAEGDEVLALLDRASR
ncbi:MAG: DUF1049 domain-containing protein [Paracoccaceae bacterium]|nr:DUF1049 domain-containing protein [Paracoccaceae bacterium]MDE2915159.1 DUF1049 domain-containing protein [Paracoccaceae bacterium]